MASPRPRDAEQPPDTFFVGPAPDAEPAPLDVRDPRNRNLFLLGPSDMDIDRLKHGASVDEPTVSASMATAALAYSGITVKMLVDKRLDAQLQTMFMVGYQPGAVAHPHDHPFEESYFMLEGEVDVVADGDRYTLRPGDVFWTGRRLHPRLLRDEGRTRCSGWRPPPPARPTATRTASSATGSTSHGGVRDESSITARRLGFGDGSVSSSGRFPSFPSTRGSASGSGRSVSARG